MATLLTAAAASRIEKSGNDLGEICRTLSSERRTPTLPGKREAICGVRRMLAQNSAMRSADALVRCCDDSIELIRIGKRGGLKVIARVWNKEGLPV